MRVSVRLVRRTARRWWWRAERAGRCRIAFFAAAPSVTELWWKPENGRPRRVASSPRRGAGGRVVRAGERGGGGAAAGARAGARAQLRAGARRRRVRGHGRDRHSAGGGRTHASSRSSGITTRSRRCTRSSRFRPSAVAGRVEDHLEAALPADVVLLNPPRNGVDARVTAALEQVATPPRAIIYVSCDPGHARARPRAPPALSPRERARVRHVPADGARGDRVRARAGGRMKYFVKVAGTELELERDGDDVDRRRRAHARRRSPISRARPCVS